MFKKLACFTGWLLVLCLSLLFFFTLGLWRNWSTPLVLVLWLAMLLLAGLLWCSLSAILQFIQEKKGRHWFEKFRLPRREYVLREHWKSGANVIRRIRGQRKNLPWFLLTGDRCGKSTLLASTEIPRFYGDNDEAVVTRTRTLQWWFFRQIGILDLSSQFLNGSARFRQGGRRLISWCFRMPAPAGILIAVSMEQLMNADRSALHALGRQQRALIAPLIRRYGNNLPLHVIVTRSDVFPGFSLWQQQLSAVQRQHVLGYHWPVPPHVDGQDATTLQPLFSALKQGMSRVRLSMAPRTLTPMQHVTLLDFPEAFAKLEPALRYTVASLCEPNAYFSHSALRGVWFTATELQPDNHGRRTSLFTHDLLTKHLPAMGVQQNGEHWYQRRCYKWICTGILGLIMVWLMVSGSQSSGRLNPTLEQQSPDTLAVFLARDEQYATFSLRYLPFQPLFQQQQQRAISLLDQVHSVPRLAQTVFADYQRQTSAAIPAQQRELILQLADAILLWQQMRDGASLNTLHQASPVSSALLQRTYPDTLSPLARLALERHYIQHPEGERWLQAAQRLLTELIHQDPSFTWLTAPSATIPGLQAKLFWPSMPLSVELNGIWTHEGTTAIKGWITHVEQALGYPQPQIQQMFATLPALRQDAWRRYLVDVTASLSAVDPVTLSRTDLLALGQNKSPAMRFAQQLLSELSTVLPSDSQPWLMTLRQLQMMGNRKEAESWLDRAAHADRHLRQSLTAWLQNRPITPRITAPVPFQPLWVQWQKARDGAVMEAVAQGTPGTDLTRGLFKTTEKGEHNSLSELLPTLSALKEAISPQNNDPAVAGIWLLYKNDASRLLGNAMAQSACWLNNQWKSKVIWPLGKDAELRNYDEQQTLSQQFLLDFMHGPAKALMRATDNGPAPAEYAGMALPLTPEFLRLARQEFSDELLQDLPQRASTRNDDRHAALQDKVNALSVSQAALEKNSWKVTLTSQPATIPGGARVIPTGTELTLHCRKGDQRLSSMNFADRRDFRWQPGQCSGLTLSIIFPDFTAHYQADGEDAWPRFISRLASGSVLLNSEDFGGSSGTLESMGIKQIMARFAVSDTQPLEAAFQTWSEQAKMLDDLYARLADLSTLNNDSTFYPLSALPGDIAQCQ